MKTLHRRAANILDCEIDTGQCQHRKYDEEYDRVPEKLTRARRTVFLLPTLQVFWIYRRHFIRNEPLCPRIPPGLSTEHSAARKFCSSDKNYYSHLSRKPPEFQAVLQHVFGYVCGPRSNFVLFPDPIPLHCRPAA